jgi:hypothetical protein
MPRSARIAAVTAALILGGSTLAVSNPTPPTNGGSANGNGSSGQCTGAEADRPPSCHNSTGGDGN